MNEIATTQPVNDFAVIERLVANGASPDQLDKFIQVFERVRDDNRRAEYQRAMTECQREMPAVIKSKKGQNSKYAPLEEIDDAIRPVYTKHGFSLSFDTADSNDPKRMRIVVDVMHSGGHKETKHLDLTVDKSGSMNEVQGGGSTVSYGRRYLTCMVFNVAIAGEDTDAARSSQRLTDEQAEQVVELANATEADTAKLLAWAGADSIRDIPAKRFPEVVKMLRRKQADKAKKEAAA